MPLPCLSVSILRSFAIFSLQACNTNAPNIAKGDAAFTGKCCCDGVTRTSIHQACKRSVVLGLVPLLLLPAIHYDPTASEVKRRTASAMFFRVSSSSALSSSLFFSLRSSEDKKGLQKAH